jgi:hypothetical protein
MGRLKHALKVLWFFSIKFWVEGVGGGFFFILPMFPLCYLQVPSELPLGFEYVLKIPNVFPKGVPNNTSLYPICFVQSPPILTYIGGPKGDALHLSI